MRICPECTKKHRFDKDWNSFESKMVLEKTDNYLQHFLCPKCGFRVEILLSPFFCVAQNSRIDVDTLKSEDCLGMKYDPERTSKHCPAILSVPLGIEQLYGTEELDKLLERVHNQDELTEAEAWQWIDRPLPLGFFDMNIHLTPQEEEKRFKEIPDKLKVTVQAIIALFTTKKIHEMSGDNCRFARHILYHLKSKLKEDGVELFIPNYWFIDGVMIHPEWIVRITNGIIKWKGDESCQECGRDDCMFFVESKHNGEN